MELVEPKNNYIWLELEKDENEFRKLSIEDTSLLIEANPEALVKNLIHDNNCGNFQYVNQILDSIPLSMIQDYISASSYD